MESLGMVQEAKVVVGLDFGTTFSGFAYALRADPDNVYTFYDWPMQAEGGGLPYCKTQTSLLYAASSDASHDVYELRAWGWPARVEYCASSNFPAAPPESLPSAASGSGSSVTPARDLHSSSGLTRSSGAGHFLTLFKLHLAAKDSSVGDHKSDASAPPLPPGMTARRPITDFLSQISKLILQEVQNKFGAHISSDDVQWCLTVPAVWDERAKREMKLCAEIAGLVQGAQSKEAGSPHPLKLFIEPEAASVYCQQKLKNHTWNKGDKFLVVDCGGGTVDLVLHEKLASAPTLSVREVQASSGALCGGSRVDEEFLFFLRRKISCFKNFEEEHPAIVLDFRQDWEKIKFEFDGCNKNGGVALELPPQLATLWEEDAEAIGSSAVTSSPEPYDEFVLTNQDMKSIFDPVVNRILKLIEDRMVSDLQAIMVVGGFSASPYLMRRIRETFSGRVAAIASPPYPGSAVCCGAVTMGIRSDTVVSRVAKKTYGVKVLRRFQDGVHPPEYKILDDGGNAHCDNIFSIFVREGDEVRFDDSVKHCITPLNTDQVSMSIELHASKNRNPRYVGGSESRKDGVVVIGFPSYRELGFWPDVEVSVYFGRTEIQVSAVGENFNSVKKEMLPVKFERDSIY